MVRQNARRIIKDVVQFITGCGEMGGYRMSEKSSTQGVVNKGAVGWYRLRRCRWTRWLAATSAAAAAHTPRGSAASMHTRGMVV